MLKKIVITVLKPNYMKMKYILCILTAMLLLILSCAKEEIARPELGPNEVGLVNETNTVVKWGVNKTGSGYMNDFNVDPSECRKREYWHLGYYVNPIAGSGYFQPVFVDPGKFIVVYQEGDKYKYKIE
jgi:hypothetical protein